MDQQSDAPGHSDGGHSQSAETASSDVQQAPHSVGGVTVAQNGYQLEDLSVPERIGQDGELSFTVAGSDGSPVTAYEVEHEQELHLIVVRSDGNHYRHVHPVMDEAGRWSLPWSWDAAGTYRVYADIAPTEYGKKLTLTSTVNVAGDFQPTTPEVSTTTTVDGFDVSLKGDLSAGAASTLTVSVERDGQPETGLQPYLGAYGHLVALREGDLAYLHVHPEGAEPVGEETSGPKVEFATTAPTTGRYYLYFDFQVDGTVHTARFTLDTTGSDAVTPDHGTTHGSTSGDTASEDSHSDH
ncbi:heavy-metal-associated domain-containing protein [Arthrobacter sp. SX1312]|uniref:heavy-metal-associated domain-containing protein n=1 Tax=Arthrobacter sp. SX1312 TaxID=2058896 RepID=UPI001CA5DAAD|nr:heavy-metal-associated domain-containing protein [Arthrobacter sp. SX1312]